MMETTYLKEAQDFVFNNVDKGIICPCCNQYAKRYRRKLTSSMAMGLILLCKGIKVDEMVHLLKYFQDKKVSASVVGNIPMLQHWGLLIKDTTHKDDSNPDCGVYTVTQKAFDFINCKITLPKYAIIYNNVLEKLSDPIDGWTNIHEALGKHFNYYELMKS